MTFETSALIIIAIAVLSIGIAIALGPNKLRLRPHASGKIETEHTIMSRRKFIGALFAGGGVYLTTLGLDRLSNETAAKGGGLGPSAFYQLNDVRTVQPIDGDVWTWNASNKKWLNKALPKLFYQKIGNPLIIPPPLSALAQEPGLQMESLNGSIVFGVSDNPDDSTVFDFAVQAEPTIVSIVRSRASAVGGLTPLPSSGDHVHGFAPVEAQKTGNYTITTTDFCIDGIGGAGGITITLPPAGNIGMWVHVKKIDAGVGAVTIAAGTGDNIEGATTVVLAAQWNGVILRSRGVNTWIKVATT